MIIDDSSTLNDKSANIQSVIVENFSLKNISQEDIKQQLEVNWNLFNEYEISNESKIYEYETSYNSILSNSTGKNYFLRCNVQATFDNNSSVTYRIIKYISKDKNILKDINLESLDGFSGTISEIDLEGTVIKTRSFSKGILMTDTSSDSNLSSSDLHKEAPIGETMVPVPVDNFTDWYTSFEGNLYYQSSQYNYTRIEWVLIDTGEYNSEYTQTMHEHLESPISGPHGGGPSDQNHVIEKIPDGEINITFDADDTALNYTVQNRKSQTHCHLVTVDPLI